MSVRHRRPKPGGRRPYLGHCMCFVAAAEKDEAEEEEGECPLKSLHYTVRVEGWVAEVTVEQEFQNCEGRPVEGVYQFPCLPNAAVTGVKVRVGGRTVVAKVMEAGQARDAYDDGVAMGMTAALVEKKAQTDDVYQITVGSLPPDATATVVLTYAVELILLPTREGQLVIPLTTMPRYEEPAKGADGTAKAPPTTRHSQQPYTATITCTTADPAVTGISSPSHDVGDMTVPREYTPNRDVVICVATAEKGPVLVTCSTDAKARDHMTHALAIPLKPKYSSEEVKASLKKAPNTEVVVLLDCSGSMSGEPIRACERVAKYFAQSLPPACNFNIIRFGGSFESLFPGTTPMTAKALEDAKVYVNNLKANLGGTNLLGPLTELYKRAAKRNCSRQFLVITDGAVENTNDVLKLVGSKSGSTKVFSVGLGSSCSKELVDGLARFGNGTATYISDNAHMTSQVMQIVKHMIQPSITQCSIKSTVLGLRMASTAVPPVFYNTSYMAYAFAPSAWDPETLATTAVERVAFDTEKNMFAIESQSGLLMMTKGDTAVGPVDTQAPVIYDGAKQTVKFTTTRGKEVVTKPKEDFIPEIGRFLNRYGVANTLFKDMTVEGHVFGLSDTAPAKQGHGYGEVLLSVAEKTAKPEAVRVTSMAYDKKRKVLTVKTVKKAVTVWTCTDEGHLPVLGDMANAALVAHNLPSSTGAVINFVYEAEGEVRVVPCVGGSKGSPYTHKMAAFKLLKQLEDGDLVGQPTKKEIIETSLACGLLSKFTAFVAVDEDGDPNAAQEAMAIRRVPLSQPEGWAVPKTSRPRVTKTSLLCAGGITGALMPRGARFLEKCDDRLATSTSRESCKKSRRKSAPVTRSAEKRSAPASPACAYDSDSASEEDYEEDDFQGEKLVSHSESAEEDDFEGEKFVSSRSKSASPDEILYMQSFDGSWDLTPALARLLSTTVERVKEEAAANGVPVPVWTTVVVLRHLQSEHSETKDEWELMYEKAVAFLSDAGYPNVLTA
eukprot:TRINITY_DN361_c0_g3_i2.p1 TRINITY_DN361_c0_g3~~TRINITY_DN361_c0_g3_i2.p1  ORF type:complete len:1006 (+),score=334.64 TRINITY_DN361_c0_g3_i2:47-3064(+)